MQPFINISADVVKLAYTQDFAFTTSVKKCKMQNAECRIKDKVMSTNVSVQKSFDFAVRIVNLYRYLTNE